MFEWLKKLRKQNDPKDELFTVVEVIKLGPHRYLVTTESVKYGRVTQEVIEVCLKRT